MLRSSSELKRCRIGATDGTIGHVDDLFFDDEAWVIRYLVVAAGSWLLNRKVLVPPVAIVGVDWAQRILTASITTEQVREGPDIDTDKPVTRQHEVQYLEYYRYPSYWERGGVWGATPNPGVPPMNMRYLWSGRESLQTRMDRGRAEVQRRERDDPHLRSCNAVMKYHIGAKDGAIGHAYDLLVDEETWAIRYLVVDTSNWWRGHKVLVAPEWVESVNWSECRIEVDLTRQILQAAPQYDSTVPLGSAREAEMCEYYARAGFQAADANRSS